MSQNTPINPGTRARRNKFPLDVLAFPLLALLLAGGWWFLSTTPGSTFTPLMERIFALSSQQVMWFITRAAGIIAYLLLWLSMIWGLVIPTKIFGEHLNGDFSFDFHQFLSLLALGFLGLHIFILTADRYLPFTIAEILVPFLAPYRPAWVGIGTIAMYLLVLVTVTFYIRQKIGKKAFRYIHVTSLVAYLGAVGHAFMAGTDSSLPAIQLMYAITILPVVFLTVYWLIGLIWEKLVKANRNIRPVSKKISHRPATRFSSRT